MRKGRLSLAAASGKPPVILCFVDDPVTTISIGHSDVPLPKHTVTVPPIRVAPTTSAQQLFPMYGEPILTLFHRLGYSASNVPSAVLIVHDQGTVVNRQWKWAICRILSNLLHVEWIRFQPSIQLAPMAISLPHFNTHTWLCVHMTRYEAQVMVVADGHSLEYTFQSVRFVSGQTKNSAKTESELWTVHQSNISGIVKALCLTVIKTPMELRKAVVGNLLVSGHGLLSNFGTRLARALYECLETRTMDDQVDVAPQTIDFAVLEKLAHHIGLVQTAVPPPNLTWVGACLWIARRQQEQQQQQVVDENPLWTKLEQTYR